MNILAITIDLSYINATTFTIPFKRYQTSKHIIHIMSDDDVAKSVPCLVFRDITIVIIKQTALTEKWGSVYYYIVYTVLVCYLGNVTDFIFD